MEAAISSHLQHGYTAAQVLNAFKSNFSNQGFGVEYISIQKANNFKQKIQTHQGGASSGKAHAFI